MKKHIVLLLALLLTVALTVSAFGASAASYIDNSKLIPKYRPSSEVETEELNSGVWSPDWMKELIMAQVRIETCTEEGTFASAVKMLDHYAEMGINGLWVNPIYDRVGTDHFAANGYGNFGPETVWPELTGTDDYDEGFKVVKKFVDEAHKRNIRILFDVVVWGTANEAPVYAAHKFDYFSGREVWGGKGFAWDMPKFKNWFTDACVDFILKTGADGFRCDLEPTITGYPLFQNVRDKLELDHGVKIAIMSEGTNDRRQTYDFEENGVYSNFYLKSAYGEGVIPNDVYGEPSEENVTLGLVESVKTGRGVGLNASGGVHRYYTYNLCNHDDGNRNVNGNLLSIGWQAIFAPYIPIWYIGEEWNNPRRGMGGTGVIYFDYVDWTAIDKNRAFYETVKQYIRIRRSYPEIFEQFAYDHRDSNICKLKVTGVITALDAYARYGDGKAVLIVPNDDVSTAKVKVTVPYADAKLSSADTYTVTDLMTGKVIVAGGTPKSFSSSIKPGEIGVYLVEGVSTTPTTTKKPTAGPTTEKTTATEPVSTAPPTSEPVVTEEPETTEPIVTEEPATSEPAPPTSEPITEPKTEETAGELPLPALIGIIAGGVVVLGGIVALIVVLAKKH